MVLVLHQNTFESIKYNAWNCYAANKLYNFVLLRLLNKFLQLKIIGSRDLMSEGERAGNADLSVLAEDTTAVVLGARTHNP